jgi:hypothetical protein
MKFARFNAAGKILALALVALLLMGGGAYALVVTGRQVKNETLTGKDTKNGSLGAGELAPGVIPPSQVYFTKPGGQVNIPTGAATTLATLNLPKGKWLVQANTAIVNFQSNSDFVRCSLFEGTNQLSGTTTTPEDENPVSDLTTNGFFSKTTASTVTFKCGRDGGGGLAVDPYAESIQLFATPVKQIVNQTPTP